MQNRDKLTFEKIRDFVELYKVNSIIMAKRDGENGTFDISPEALSKYGLQFLDRVETPNGDATVIGEAPSADTQKHLWFIVDDENGLSFWGRFSKVGSIEGTKICKINEENPFLNPVFEGVMKNLQDEVSQKQREQEEKLKKLRNSLQQSIKQLMNQHADLIKLFPENKDLKQLTNNLKSAKLVIENENSLEKLLQIEKNFEEFSGFLKRLEEMGRIRVININQELNKLNHNYAKLKKDIQGDEKLNQIEELLSTIAKNLTQKQSLLTIERQLDEIGKDLKTISKLTSDSTSHYFLGAAMPQEKPADKSFRLFKGVSTLGKVVISEKEELTLTNEKVWNGYCNKL